MKTRFSDCQDWQMRMIQYIKTHDWGMLEPSPCVFLSKETREKCHICSYRIVCHPLTYFLNGLTFHRDEGVILSEWTRKEEEAVERLYGGALTQDDWFQLFHNLCAPSHNLLRYLFSNHRLDPNKSDPYSLLSLFMAYSDELGIEYLLSSEVKMDINIQNSSSGNTALLDHMIGVYEDCCRGLTYEECSDDLEQSLRRILYFLERGSDPLLENKDGQSAMSLALSLTDFPAKHQNELITMLERYA